MRIMQIGLWKNLLFLFSRTRMEGQSLSSNLSPSRKSDIQIFPIIVSIREIINPTGSKEKMGNRQKAIVVLHNPRSEGNSSLATARPERSFLRHWHAHVIRTHLLVDSLNPQPVMRQSAQRGPAPVQIHNFDAIRFSTRGTSFPRSTM